MSVLLLDASVWIASVDGDDRHHAAARELIADGPGARELAALDLTVFEVANVAVRSWRDVARATRLAELVEVSCASDLERIDGETAAYTVRIADELGLTAYDAAYVAVSRRRGWTLVSCDMKDLVGPGHAVAPDDVPPLAS
ncbi:type II toxin-antitoxin system VapC family toxin [Conexibacter woesei]|uniref:Ribonuclease VapC n=1 Tax=Conexibacter woesei (strain DSM 14684 / CCUG 47730 / CIP 108061 / JCM 11494 / NBRC 100937 / ID131577) TaxID=469383 RepID=D3F539_CONWI|nr:type II toxin-antitoxin system VapC family toxin [Conexibacter woesei]ADB48617.1 PilT protein domain protein [Conexibacter woesei DSM 14684]